MAAKVYAYVWTDGTHTKTIAKQKEEIETSAKKCGYEVVQRFEDPREPTKERPGDLSRLIKKCSDVDCPELILCSEIPCFSAIKGVVDKLANVKLQLVGGHDIPWNLPTLLVQAIRVVFPPGFNPNLTDQQRQDLVERLSSRQDKPGEDLGALFNLLTKPEQDRILQEAAT